MTDDIYKLGGQPDTMGLRVHALIEFALGKITAQQAIDAFALDAQDQQDALALRNAIVAGNAALVGNTPALRALEVLHVFALAEAGLFYTTPAQVRARLGV